MEAAGLAASRPPNDGPTPLFVGQHESQRSARVDDQLLGQAQQLGYNFVTAPLTTSHFQSRVLATLEQHVQQLKEASRSDHVPLPAISPLSPQDTDLTPEHNNSALVGVVSPWIDLGSPDPLIAHVSRQVFRLEVSHAAFCGMSNALVHGPLHESDVVQYARAILEGIRTAGHLSFQILLPTNAELEALGADGTHLAELARAQYSPALDDDEDAEGRPDDFERWQTWNTIRTVCGYSQLLTVALEIPRNLPPLALQSRWYSEPVRALVIPRTSFLRNAKGFPVLSKAHQTLLTRFLRLRYVPWVLLADVDSIVDPENTCSKQAKLDPTPAEASERTNVEVSDPLAHLRYIRHLQQTQPAPPAMERWGRGYQDYILAPLQPLSENLESITYESFEEDLVKYEWYERAVAAALEDLRSKLGAGRPIICAVVGAGRGPLVTCALRAGKSTGIGVTVCAVEKNPNAHVLIQRRNATHPLWNKQVLVYKSDMRSWPGPTIDGKVHAVDILVSELLGSFADNELSPECLDGVQHVLHPEHGINIPQSYSAHCTPISSPRLYADLLLRTDPDKWELPAVSLLHQYDDLSRTCARTTTTTTTTHAAIFPELQPEVKMAWSFSHPLPPTILAHAKKRAGGCFDGGGWTGGDGENEHNVRACKLSFPSQNGGVCHGLAGYFETVLYTPAHGRPIELSTNPNTMDQKSVDMTSWFPIFFPIKTPIFVPEQSEIDVSMWRQTDDKKVWYEWHVAVHRRLDRHHRIKMAESELHSSQKNANLL